MSDSPKPWVTMEHPATDVPDKAVASRAAFDSVHEAKGWRIVDEHDENPSELDEDLDTELADNSRDAEGEVEPVAEVAQPATELEPPGAPEAADESSSRSRRRGSEEGA